MIDVQIPMYLDIRNVEINSTKNAVNANIKTLTIIFCREYSNWNSVIQSVIVVGLNFFLWFAAYGFEHGEGGAFTTKLDLKN